jgi:hypothetical protein
MQGAHLWRYVYCRDTPKYLLWVYSDISCLFWWCILEGKFRKWEEGRVMGSALWECATKDRSWASRLKFVFGGQHYDGILITLLGQGGDGGCGGCVSLGNLSTSLHLPVLWQWSAGGGAMLDRDVAHLVLHTHCCLVQILFCVTKHVSEKHAICFS